MNQSLIRYGRIFSLLGLQWCARLVQPSNNLRVTYTHEVEPCDLQNFDKIVRYLKRIRNVISPQEFFSASTGHRPILPGKTLLMTFDDGLLSSFLAAKTVLAHHDIKAIFFIPTAILDLKTEDEMRLFAASHIYYDPASADSLTPAQFQFMTADHLRELASEGHTICPHTHNHVFLRDIATEEAAKVELIRPREILEDLLHRKISAFAFPVGTEKQAGSLAYSFIRRSYRFCFTALNGVNSEKTAPHSLYRDCLPADAPLSYVRMVMAGAYDLWYRIKMNRLTKTAAPGWSR